jgi:arylsulfatase
LVPILRGRTRQGHASICWEHEGNRAVRQGRWKLVDKYPDRWELYDMTADRTEMHELSAKEPAKMQELLNIYEQWAQRCGVRPWDEIKGKSPI